MKIRKIRKILNRKRRGVIPLLAIVVLALIPVMLYIAWQLAKILIGEVKEKV